MGLDIWKSSYQKIISSIYPKEMDSTTTDLNNFTGILDGLLMIYFFLIKTP